VKQEKAKKTKEKGENQEMLSKMMEVIQCMTR